MTLVEVAPFIPVTVGAALLLHRGYVLQRKIKQCDYWRARMKEAEARDKAGQMTEPEFNKLMADYEAWYFGLAGPQEIADYKQRRRKMAFLPRR